MRPCEVSDIILINDAECSLQQQLDCPSERHSKSMCIDEHVQALMMSVECQSRELSTEHEGNNCFQNQDGMQIFHDTSCGYTSAAVFYSVKPAPVQETSQGIEEGNLPGDLGQPSPFQLIFSQ